MNKNGFIRGGLKFLLGIILFFVLLVMFVYLAIFIGSIISMIYGGSILLKKDKENKNEGIIFLVAGFAVFIFCVIQMIL